MSTKNVSITKICKKDVETFFVDIDLYNEQGQRLNPREWFVVPFEVIEETIQLILNENIVNYEYDPLTKKIKLK